MVKISGLSFDVLVELYSTKQETHEPHRSFEKQFQSITIFAQSCDNIIILIKREKKSVHFKQGCIVPSLVEICLLALEKMIFKIRQCFCTISLSSAFAKKRGPSFEQK